jgi:hypothetical protein
MMTLNQAHCRINTPLGLHGRVAETGSRLEHFDSKQARHKGRAFLVPDLDFSRLRAHAAFDTVVLQVDTTGPTHWRNLQREIEGAIGYRPWVETAGHSDFATRFFVTIQDPTHHCLAPLATMRGFGGSPLVVRLDVALDFRLAKHSNVATDDKVRAQLAAALARVRDLDQAVISDPAHKTRPAKRRGPRIGTSSDDTKPFRKVGGEYHSMPQHLHETFWWGAQHEGGRIYHKTIDRIRDGVGIPLPNQRRLIRDEVNVFGEALAGQGIQTVADLMAADTSQFRHFFGYSAPTIAIHRPLDEVNDVVRRLRNQWIINKFATGTWAVREFDSKPASHHRNQFKSVAILNKKNGDAWKAFDKLWHEDTSVEDSRASAHANVNAGTGFLRASDSSGSQQSTGGDDDDDGFLRASHRTAPLKASAGDGSLITTTTSHTARPRHERNQGQVLHGREAMETPNAITPPVTAPGVVSPSAEESFSIDGVVKLLAEIVETEAAMAERRRCDYEPPIHTDAEIDGMLATIDITLQRHVRPSRGDESIVQTAKPNGVNPEASLRDTLGKIANGHPISRVDELMTWAPRELGDS